MIWGPLDLCLITGFIGGSLIIFLVKICETHFVFLPFGCVCLVI